ncbi:MAG: signal peptidase I [Polyangiaceae bacterium]|nr:signal peptidase I [Polyangiaceae bacterium]
MRNLLRGLAWVLLVVALIVGGLRALALRWWQVPTDDPFLEASVSPTLSPGDWILLWRATAPKFGDLVLCPEPGAPARVVIGRIAAEEGQDVRVEGEHIYLDDRKIPNERACDPATFTVADPNSGSLDTMSCDEEALASGTHKRGVARGAVAQPHVRANLRVPKGKVYLVSDNRKYPYDSRDFGTVPRETCKEHVFFRVMGVQGLGDVATRFTTLR